MHRTLCFRALTALAAAAIPTLASLPAFAASDAPAGNNGTIKIDDVAMDDGNENVPHPGCTFVVDFFGYDVGTRVATLDFEGQAPTGGGSLFHDSFTFEVASRESGNQLDASREVDLSDELAGIEPHPQQGWHVKLTVHVDGAQGADVKHKVFWVSDCEEAAAPAAEEESAPPAAEAPEVETPDTDTGTTEVLGEAEAVELWNRAAWMHALEANGAGAEAPATAAVLAAETTAPAGAGAAAAPAATLPRTGAATDALVPLGLGLVATGAGLIWTARRKSGYEPKHLA